VELVSSANMAAVEVACIGECMLEVASLGDGNACLGFGGDTLNTAVYLARGGVSVGYHSALGDDDWSRRMLAAWHEEDIDVDWVECVAGSLPGLYLIETDPHGERRFSFWRDASPARRLTELPRWSERTAALRAVPWIYLSAITLSILGAAGRERLVGALREARTAGARIAFDGNYRPRNWPDAGSARRATEELWALTDLALPTFDDEAHLHGDSNPADTLRRLRAAGVKRAAIKLGAAGALVADGDAVAQIPARPVERVVDSTAAGDAFNAGALGALLQGRTWMDAVPHGHALASRVIQHHGAIVPRELTASAYPNPIPHR
jgi:2-dehydro-3-deoxygluconokinase